MKRKAIKIMSYLCILSISLSIVPTMPVSAAEVNESVTAEAETAQMMEEEVVSEPETSIEETMDTEVQGTELIDEESLVEEELAEVVEENADITSETAVEVSEELSDEMEEETETELEVQEAENVEVECETAEPVQPAEVPTVSGNDAAMESSVFSDEVPTYVDELGNIFTYTVDESGNATITGITLSGANLIIPETMDGIPVIAVSNGIACVVTNPTVRVPELTINCNSIGVKAFSGVSIGTLTIGENVKSLSVSNEVDYGHIYHYHQFSNATIDKVIFNATEIILDNNVGSVTNIQRGPFYGSTIQEIEFGSNVLLIPECLFQGATMQLGTLELQVPCVGGDAFYSPNISIEHLIIGENVQFFDEFSNSTNYQHYWEQFASTTIGKLTLRAPNLVYRNNMGKHSTNTLTSAFAGAKIGTLEIDSSVQRIPEQFIYNATIKMDELVLTTPYIGAYAFAGANIEIGTLTLARDDMKFEEFTYSTDLHHYWSQFSGSKIGTLKLQSKNLEVAKLLEQGDTSSVILYGPFNGATVDVLEIGENVERIPDLFLCNATLEMDSLLIDVPVIGSKAFASTYISFGTLTISENVRKFEQSYYSRPIFATWGQFQATQIGSLVYLAPNASIGADYLVPSQSSSVTFCGPFNSAVISSFILGEGVEYIPNYLLHNASAQIAELDLHVAKIGARAFSSQNTTIGKLVLNEEVSVMEHCITSNTTFNYWQQFGYTTIGELYYNTPSLQVENEASHDNDCRGPFYGAVIENLYLGTGIERFPAYCFCGSSIQEEEVEIHAKSIGVRAFSGSNISIDTLTLGAEVETFEWVLDGSLVNFRQFASTGIGHLKYQAVDAATNEKECYKAPFYSATIGKLDFDTSVQTVPNNMFRDALMDLDTLVVNVPSIGMYSFSGKNIIIDDLTIGENVTTFPADSSNYNRAFMYSTIQQLNYNATEANMEKLSSSVSGPFAYSTKIYGLTFGDNVKIIPYGCFKDSTMNVDEVTINTAIGFGAFDSSNINIGILNMENDATYAGKLSNSVACFKYAKIGTLNFNSNAVSGTWSENSNTSGMFSRAVISQLNIGEDVEIIPAFWFKDATLTQETLIIPCNFSYQSFYSYSVDVNTLVLTDGITEFNHLNNQNNAFMGNTYDTIRYEVPNAKFTATKYNASGIFNNATITNFIVGEMVEYMDVRLFSSETVENCYVYPVYASDEHNAQTITESVMPKCTSLYIHYNSDFKPYFSRSVTDYHWMCVDYFDTSYGDKIYDEETGEYKVEIFKTCSVCGYTEEGTEELDNSYDVYLSIPVEIPLTFHAEDRAYSGSEEVYAYGTLGNAYEGLRVVTNTKAENYGKAVKEDVTYDILSYLSVSFMGSESADFTPEQLTENAAIVTSGSLEGLYQNRMDVSVNALAFIEGGVGIYQISIPIRIELY